MMQFAREVPAVAHFRILGVPLNDKWVHYVTAGALAVWQGPSSLLTCAFGALFGLLYRPSPTKGQGAINSISFSGKSLRFPSALTRLSTSLFSPLLSISDGSAGPQLTLPNSAGANARPRAGRGDLFANRANDPYAANNGANNANDGIPEHLLNQVQPSEPNIATLVEMGFPRDRAMQALSETGDSVDLAVALLTAQE